ncbi:MAG TPA: hypothetical protein PKY77_02690 [Phycisphaerae bacterium]|nr:hypothetical protein [Phycisphaerae bacterium]HRY66652.1 hypothetical protein [Phycisphaerae bacterium]HSA27645.1 hypothetical protein [Phycisphaerae bacterium]
MKDDLGTLPAQALSGAGPQLLNLRFVDVTGSRRVNLSEVRPDTPAARVLRAAARELGIPENQPVSLRRDDTQLVPPNATIGEAVGAEQQEELTVVPNAHLGCWGPRGG